jgi:hypothetical protein
MSIDFHTENLPRGLWLNVANRNGFVILTELFDLPHGTVESWGSIDPRTVLVKLATAEARITGVVRPDEDNHGERVELSEHGVAVVPTCRVITFGITRDQVERYISALRRIAEWAVEHDEEILWD